MERFPVNAARRPSEEERHAEGTMGGERHDDEE